MNTGLLSPGDTGNIEDYVARPNGVSVVPESSTLIIWMILGSLAIVALRWQKRRATRQLA